MATSPEDPMKRYGAMQFVAGLLKLLGWLIVGVGALVMFFSIKLGSSVPVSSYLNEGLPLFIGILISAAIIIVGIFAVAAGEMISAIADIAINTSHLAAIAANTGKTVGFFEHISSKDTVRSPAS